MNADRPDPSRPEDPDHGLDFDATFAEIVSRLGPLGDDGPAAEGSAPRPSSARDTDPPADPTNDGPAGPPATPPATPPADPPADPSPDALRDRLEPLFRPAWAEPQQTAATWDDEGHFVPPPPPPLPPMEPRRKAAWTALLGSPVLALLLAVLPVGVPGLVTLLLVVAFVGGFGYLVATMRSSPPDGGADDGAVV